MKKTALALTVFITLLFSEFFIFQVQGENWSTPTPIIYLEKTVNLMSSFRDNTITGLTMSADGTKIAFSARINGRNEIFVANWDGTELKQLTNDSRHNFYPSISGNGSKITFYSCSVEEFVNNDGYVYAESHSDWRVFVVNSDGTGLQQISGTGGSRYSSITDDGGKIAFLMGKEICIVNSDGTGLEKLTAPMEWGEVPSISEDGSKVVFIGEMTLNDLELFVVHSDGTNLTQITDGTGDGNGCCPSISGNGNTIVFRAWNHDKNSLFLASYNDQTSLWSTPTPIFSSEHRINWPCITADGNKIFFSTTDNYGYLDPDSDRVFTVRSDGTGLTEIYSGPQESSASITTNAVGSKIAFVDFANNVIFVCVDLDTGLNAPAPAAAPPTAPSPSTNPTPSPTPEPTPTLTPAPTPNISPTPTPTASQEPNSSQDTQKSEPTPELMVIVSTGAVSAIAVGLLVYFKKRKH